MIAHYPISWDSLREWGTALGTVGAFGVAAVAFFRAVVDRQKEQAAGVWAYCPDTTVAYGGDAAAARVEGHPEVINYSSLPVRDVQYKVHAWDRPKEWLKVGGWIVLPPGERKLLPKVEFVYEGDRPRAELQDPWGLPIVVRFTDSKGLRWQRKPNGRLRRIRRKRSKDLPV